MKFPLAFNQLQVIPTGDLSGSPAIAAGIDRNVFFVLSYTGSIIGQFAQYATLPKIVIGNWIPQGPIPSIATPTYQGVPPLPLTTELGDTQPSCCAGPNNEMYFSFTTQGSLPLKYNMDSVPSFCDCPSPGTSDICVAQAWFPPSFQFQSQPYLNWWLQDASLNSCNNEYNSQLCCDRTNRFLYMVHESSANILCFPVIGTGPNVILSCLSIVIPNLGTPSLATTGNVVWREAQTGINCAGATTNPAIATDQDGGVYVAVEINAPIQGGATPTATKVIDVIKFKNYSITPYNKSIYSSYANNIPPGVFTSMSRSYVLSGINPSIFPPDGICSKPSIACTGTASVNPCNGVSLPKSGFIVVAFTTTGTMPGQSQSSYLEPGGSDVVVVSFKSDGTLVTVAQGDVWSPAFNPYVSARDVSVTSDDAGNIFLSYIIKTGTGTESVISYQLYPSSLEKYWNYQEPGGIDYNAYAYAMTGAPNAIFNTSPLGSFTKTPVVSVANTYFAATSSTQTPIAPGSQTPTNHGFALTAYTSALYTFDTTVFNYMSQSKSICACGTNNCGCS